MESRRTRFSDGQSPAGARGQSAVLGVVLLLGFTVVVGSTVALTGMSMVQSGQESTQHQHAENEMAVLGSKIAEVGLGDSAVQRTSFSADDGEYAVREDSGTMTIEHVNYTSGETETIDEISLGAVVYENGDTEKAYQGGGVWSKTGDYASMVSPPEFHYRSGTLTLPIINVEGDDRATGGTEAVIKRTEDSRIIYPNRDESYDVNPDVNYYENPITNGTIRVTVSGDYYRGWEYYFSERTTGDVSVDHENQTVSVDLITLGDEGVTGLTDGGEINLRGFEDDDPMNGFNLTLQGDGSSGLNNLNWELSLEGEDFVELHENGGSVDVTIYDQNGTEWHGDNLFDVDDSGSNDVVHVNLTSEKKVENVDTGNESELGRIFNERLGEHAPDADLVVDDSPGNQRVNHDESQANIDYGESAQFITYLHITENKVGVEFN